MLEKYYKYKLDYRNYIILIRCGSFYVCLGKDAFILNEILGYKLKRISNTFKVGFPTSNLNKVCETLNDLKIDYLITDKNMKEEFKNNRYTGYNYNEELLFYRYLRIENIIKYLYDNLTNNIDDKLSLIENVIPK